MLIRSFLGPIGCVAVKPPLPSRNEVKEQAAYFKALFSR